MRREANDYAGKSLSGGRIACARGMALITSAPTNMSLWNLVYGAVTGDVFVGGRAGERFAVRNSGAHAVVEGVETMGANT